MAKSHEDLDVWQAAVQLAKDLYRTTSGFPREERFGLTTQMRKATVSIASNIAEGAARRSTRELVQFLYVASGSASELLTQLEIAKDVVPSHTAEAEQLREQTAAIARMLRAMIRSLNPTDSTP